MSQGQRLHEAIREARNALGWTQEALGAKAGCSRSSIASFEGGTVPPEPVLRRLLGVLSERGQALVLESDEAREILHLGAADTEPGGADMVRDLMHLRRSKEVDISGQWNAMWLTTTNRQENRNRETIVARRRWNGSWELANESISDDNPDGGYLWIARLELFDNKHLLGYYCAKERSVLAKGTLCLELQANGREILGVWDGLNFDTMWASGAVALCRMGERGSDPEPALNRFNQSRPKMPY